MADHSGAECEDCGSIHLLRESDKICPKCLKLQAYEIGSLEYIEVTSHPQCVVCGLTRRNLPRPVEGGLQTCGGAHCLELAGINPPRSVTPLGTSAVPNQANKARADALVARMKLTKTTHPNGSGTVHTTDALLHHENGGGAPGEEKITVAWQVRLSTAPNKIDGNLGSNAKKWAVSMYLPDIKAEVIKHIDIEWTKMHSQSLANDEVSFRWSDNKTLEPGTATMTLGRFYAHYSTPSNAPIYLEKIPVKWAHLSKKGQKSLVVFDAYIDVKQYSRRVEVEDPCDDISMIKSVVRDAHSSKRSRHELASEAGPSKRPCTASSALRSQFRLSTRSGLMPVHSRSRVILKKIICVSVGVDGMTEFEDPEVTIEGNIRDTAAANGQMKSVFDFAMSDNHEFVAKRFFRLREETQDEELTVSTIDNKIQIQAELSRLVLGQWFLTAFYRRARQTETEVAGHIVFAEGFLAQELHVASVASGTGPISDSNEGITWLIEKRRPATVTRFSGTLVHPSRRIDKLGSTIIAFAHFVFEHSLRNLVIADIQGTECQLRSGVDGLVLFDPMTHTKNGNSGVGDFGKDGIATFIRDHNCNDLCQSLELSKDLAVPAEVVGDDDIEDAPHTP